MPQKVWAYTIGGYPAVKKWLDYRHIDKLKRPLHPDEVHYVTEMVQRIATLLATWPSLDENYNVIKENALSVSKTSSLTSG